MCFLKEQQAFSRFLSPRHIVSKWIPLNGIKIICVALVATFAAMFCEPKRLVSIVKKHYRGYWSATVFLSKRLPSVWWGGRSCVSVFDPVARSALMLTELLGDLLGRVREPAKPPTDSIITAVVAGPLPPCCWGFVAGIENQLVCTPHWLSRGEHVWGAELWGWR